LQASEHSEAIFFLTFRIRTFAAHGKGSRVREDFCPLASSPDGARGEFPRLYQQDAVSLASYIFSTSRCSS
jgi:hypothetical protein